MKKFLVFLLVLLMLAGIGGTGYFFYQYNLINGEKEVLVRQNAELQSSIDAIGPITEVWTVAIDTVAGQEIKEEHLVKQSIPVSSLTDSYITDQNQLIGRYYKVDMHPGTSLTSDVVLNEAWESILYERDLTFDYLPLGLKVGDYIDIRMTLPYGEEFIIMQHERVQQLVAVTNTIKLQISEAQLALWTSAVTDKSLYGVSGLQLYVTKYIEPGITEEAVPFYPVRSEMESTVTLNPNIKNKKECINSDLRVKIDAMLAAVKEEDRGSLMSGKTSEASGINASKDVYIEQKTNDSTDKRTPTIQEPGSGTTQPPDNAAQLPDGSGTVQPSDGSSSPSGIITDGLEDVTQAADDIINLNPKDPYGNSSSITPQEQHQAEGDGLLTKEEVIE